MATEITLEYPTQGNLTETRQEPSLDSVRLGMIDNLLATFGIKTRRYQTREKVLEEVIRISDERLERRLKDCLNDPRYNRLNPKSKYN